MRTIGLLLSLDTLARWLLRCSLLAIAGLHDALCFSQLLSMAQWTTLFIHPGSHLPLSAVAAPQRLEGLPKLQCRHRRYHTALIVSLISSLRLLVQAMKAMQQHRMHHPAPKMKPAARIPKGGGPKYEPLPEGRGGSRGHNHIGPRKIRPRSNQKPARGILPSDPDPMEFMRVSKQVAIRHWTAL